MKVISNTEISTYNLCPKQWSFRFGLDLEPKPHRLSEPLRRGLIGHRVWETYYLHLQEGEDVNTAYKAAQKQLTEEMRLVIENDPDDDKSVEMINQLGLLLKKYVSFYVKDNFRVLAVERVYTTPVDSDIEYGLRLDLLIEMTAGQHYGELFILDHKFKYNFFTVAELEMDVQGPKYIKTLRDNNYPVKGVIFNQIRYREMKNDDLSKIFKRDEVISKKHKIDFIWEEQKRTALEIVNSPRSSRVLSPTLVCKYCPFQAPCYGEMVGQDISTDLKANYRPSSYGYGAFVNLATGD